MSGTNRFYKILKESLNKEASDKPLSTLREQLSDYEHDRWSRWMKHLFSKSQKTKEGTVVIPKESVDRWERQIKTPYKSLSEKEKDSDRKEIDGMLNIISNGIKDTIKIEKEGNEKMSRFNELQKIAGFMEDVAKGKQEIKNRQNAIDSFQEAYNNEADSKKILHMMGINALVPAAIGGAIGAAAVSNQGGLNMALMGTKGALTGGLLSAAVGRNPEVDRAFNAVMNSQYPNIDEKYKKHNRFGNFANQAVQAYEANKRLGDKKADLEELYEEKLASAMEELKSFAPKIKDAAKKYMGDVSGQNVKNIRNSLSLHTNEDLMAAKNKFEQSSFRKGHGNFSTADLSEMADSMKQNKLNNAIDSRNNARFGTAAAIGIAGTAMGAHHARNNYNNNYGQKVAEELHEEKIATLVDHLMLKKMKQNAQNSENVQNKNKVALAK